MKRPYPALWQQHAATHPKFLPDFYRHCVIVFGMRRDDTSSAPDFTNAALIMGLVNLVWIFMALWAVFGFWMVLGVGFVLDKLIRRIQKD